jgi:hypothetical protein
MSLFERLSPIMTPVKNAGAVLVNKRLLDRIEFVGCELVCQSIGYRNLCLLSPTPK